MTNNHLVLQTDFGLQDGAVSSMRGVAYGVASDIIISDLTHGITPFNIFEGSFRLFQTFSYWPAGTVFVSVVDPGVGSKRLSIIAETTGGHYIVTPDNGSLTHVKRLIGIEAVREIDESVNRLRGKGTEDVAIFHGRDLFGYTAARLASGIIDFEGVGPEYPVEEIVEHEMHEPVVEPGKAQGIFEINDPNFGNLWTNIPLKAFQEAGFAYGDHINVTVRHEGEKVFEEKVLFHQSFGFAQKGDPMIYNNEMMKVAMAVSQGSFCDKYNLSYGPEWTIEFTK